MASPLEGLMRRQIAQAFRGKLKKGQIRNYSNALDDYGDQVISDTPSEEATFEGIQENFNALWAAQSGIPDTDVSVLVLLGSIKPQSVVPAQDSLIFIENQWLRVRRVLGTDPANATMRLQAYVMTPQPT